MMVITSDGELARTMPCPVPAGDRYRLRGARKAAAAPLPPSGPVTVQRRVSSRGGIMVATQKIQVGLVHAGKIVTVTAEDHAFRLVIDGQAAGVVPRTTTSEIHRYKAYAAHPAPGKAVTGMPEVRLDAVDAAELAELLQFLAEWLARDPARLGASLEAFVGHPAYNLGELRQDLNRFTFLLGGDDGESLFGHGTAGEVRDHDQPAARAQGTEGGGFAAAHLPARRACYGAAPPASRVLRIPLRGTRLRRALDPGDRCGPWEQEERAGPGLPPRCARRAKPGGGGPQEPAGRQDTGELAFDSHKEAENYKPRVVSRIK